MKKKTKNVLTIASVALTVSLGIVAYFVNRQIRMINKIENNYE